MKAPTSSSLAVLALGCAALLASVNVLVRGNIWNLVLGGERYLVGGVFFVFALYCLYVGIANRRR